MCFFLNLRVTSSGCLVSIFKVQLTTAVLGVVKNVIVHQSILHKRHNATIALFVNLLRLKIVVVGKEDIITCTNLADFLTKVLQMKGEVIVLCGFLPAGFMLLQVTKGGWILL